MSNGYTSADDFMRELEVEDLAGAIQEALKQYGDDVTEYVKKKVDTTADDVMQSIKDHVTFNGKDYVKAFRLKTTKNEPYNKEKTWYVKEPYYRLTHLLERGHQKRNGGRTRAYPHIKYGQEIAERMEIELRRGEESE